MGPQMVVGIADVHFAKVAVSWYHVPNFGMFHQVKFGGSLKMCIQGFEIPHESVSSL